MAIKLSNSPTFVIIPEGRHTFKINEAKYDEDFGKMEITLVTADGMKQVERFTLLDNNGEYNEKAINAFSYFARVATGNLALEEIEAKQLVGCYINAEVAHTKVPSNKDPQKTVTFVNLKNYEMAKGFNSEKKSEFDF